MLNDPKHEKFTQHVKAIEAHKALLENLHLQKETDFKQAQASLENIALTLEEYLKLVGIP